MKLENGQGIYKLTQDGVHQKPNRDKSSSESFVQIIRVGQLNFFSLIERSNCSHDSSFEIEIDIYSNGWEKKLEAVLVLVIRDDKKKKTYPLEVFLELLLLLLLY